LSVRSFSPSLCFLKKLPSLHLLSLWLCFS
jgi:hypothetical protein